LKSRPRFNRVISISFTAILVITIIGIIPLLTSPSSDASTGVEPVLADTIGYFAPSATPRTFWAQGGNIWLAPTGTQLRLEDNHTPARFHS